MDKEKHEKFMHDQVKEIKKFKNGEDKKAGKKLGNGIIHDWVKERSANFRKNWEKDHT